MKLRRVEGGPFSAYETLDGRYAFVFAPGPQMRLVWFVYDNEDKDDPSPMWSRGFWLLREAKAALESELKT